MTYKELTEAAEEVKDKSIKDMPVVLWNRFVGTCKSNGMTVTQGIIEAINLFLEKHTL